MANWSKAFEALERGLGEQVKIGGLMFQDAQMREGRAYEAAMAKESEARANTEWRERHRLQTEAAEGVATTAFGREQELLTQQRELDRQDWVTQSTLDHQRDLKVMRMDQNFQIRMALDKAESATEVAKIKAYGERLNKLYDQYQSLHEHRPDNATYDPDSKEWGDGGLWYEELKATEEAIQNASIQAGLDPIPDYAANLKDRELVGAVDHMSLLVLNDMGKAERKEVLEGLTSEKDSKSYKGAVKTLDGLVDDFVNDPNRFPRPVSARERSKYRKALIDNLTTKAHGFKHREAAQAQTPDAMVASNAGIGDASRAISALVQMSQDEMAEFVESGSMAAALAMTSPTKGGRVQSPKDKAIARAEVRDPEYLLELLMSVRDKPAYGSRRGEIDQIITKLQMIVNPAAPPPDITEFEVDDSQLGASVGPTPGLINQLGGMIDMVDQGVSYAPEDVNARWANV
tara:strand:+ start:950 stop:2329 length:1380 start_codon:yes stop_codon:yes gene_type:complete